MKTSRRSFLNQASMSAVFCALYPADLSTQPDPFKRLGGAKLKLSLNAYSFNQPLRSGEMSLFDMLEYCARLGFEAVDPTGYYFPGYPEVPSDEYINDFKRRAFVLGLDISGTGVRNNFTSPDQEERAKDVMLVKQWIEASAKMGAPLIRVFAGRNHPEGYSQDQVDEWLVADLRECADYGKKFGVLIALQNHNDYIKTSDHVIKILEMADHQWLGLHLDIGSLRQGDPYEEVSRLVPYAINWQVKEQVYRENMPEPTDLLKVMQIAHKGGYRGYLPLETLGEGDPRKKVEVLYKQAVRALNIIENS
ncbi:MAG: sugar phosphate isomerase/epimerase family protein [Candidatus Cyclobacteriaceae bacterium M3_2C_046]